MDVAIRDHRRTRGQALLIGSVCLSAVMALVAQPACSKHREVRRPLTETARSAHYVFHFAPGDDVNVEWQERYFDWATATIGVTVDRPINYYKYMSRDHMNEVIGVGNSNAHANAREFALHTLWRSDNHETVHLLAARFAPQGSVPLFGEGFAVAHQVNPVKGDFAPNWNGRYLPEHLAALHADGRFVPPHLMLSVKAFRAVDDVVSYPIAGSFMRDLLDQFGYAKVKDLMRRTNANDRDAAVRETFASIFGLTIEQAETAWLDRNGIRQERR